MNMKNPKNSLPIQSLQSIVW